MKPYVYIRHGQLTKHSDSEGTESWKLNGLGRKIRLVAEYDDEGTVTGYNRSLCYFQEGQFQEDELHGFGRKLWSNRHSFIGWIHNALLHGYVRQIYSNGSQEEGLFYNHSYAAE